MSTNQPNKSPQRKRTGSFRRKLILLILAQTFLVISIVAISDTLSTQSILKKGLETSSNSIINEIDHSIKLLINGFKSSALYFSEKENIKELVKTDTGNDAVMKEFELFANSSENILNVYAASEAKGMYLYPLTELPADYDPTSRGWYKGAVSTDGVYIEDPYVDVGTQKVVITIAKSIKDDAGKIIGVFAIDVSLESLANDLNNIVIAKTGYPILVDKEFKTLTHKDPKLINELLPVPTIVDALKANESGTIRYNYNDESKVAIYKKLETLNVYLLTTIPISDISTDLNVVLISAIGVGLFGLLLSAVLAYILAVFITKHIKNIVKGLDKIRQGDLTTIVRVSSNDELGVLADSLNDTIYGINTIVQEIQRAVDDVTTSSQVLANTAELTRQSAEEVTRTAEEISKGAIDQAEEAESGAHMTNTLAKGIDELTESTNFMSELARNTSSSNQRGVEAITELSKKTAENDLATARIESSIIELDNKTKEIGNILITINSIANQTNLLALNASIEAARAGEHGRGFAVVAEEIRKLAEDSRTATENIQQIVVNIQKDSNQTVAVMQDVKARSLEQSNAVTNVNNTFETISKNVDSISNQIKNITSFMTEMNTQKDNIVMSITNISSISEETAAASEEVTASMEQQTSSTDEVARLANNLSELSTNLRNSITKFKLK